jgi:hypothetical protein
MFTPPPSPAATATMAPRSPPTSSPASPSSSTHLQVPSVKGKEPAKGDQHRAEAGKRRTGRRYRFLAVSIPLAAIALTLCATYLLQSTAASGLHLPSSWDSWIDDLSPRLPLFRRSPEPEPQAGTPTTNGAPTATTGGAASTSNTPVANQPIPTVPSAPPTLPTPFPQSFDGSLSQNFSSPSCTSFFSNMTSSRDFRTCRPFSLLLQTSSGFIEAQTNLTLMNSLVWGTCNTNTAFDQCKANLSWFATTLQTSCTEELKQRKELAVNTLIGLQAFEIMHNIGCLQDPTSNTYCYLNAVRNSNPSDTYYYSLPLGLSLPKTIVPSCSACSKTIMAMFAAYLQDPGTSGGITGGTGLKSTYENAAAVCRQNCGAQFAQTGVVVGGALVMRTGGMSWVLVGVLGSLVWFL